MKVNLQTKGEISEAKVFFNPSKKLETSVNKKAWVLSRSNERLYVFTNSLRIVI